MHHLTISLTLWLTFWRSSYSLIPSIHCLTPISHLILPLFSSHYLSLLSLIPLTLLSHLQPPTAVSYPNFFSITPRYRSPLSLMPLSLYRLNLIQYLTLMSQSLAPLTPASLSHPLSLLFHIPLSLPFSPLSHPTLVLFSRPTLTLLSRPTLTPFTLAPL